MRGIYCVLEGIEGSGKSSVLSAIAEKLKTEYPEINLVTTRHPGATSLGAHLRKLVKYPEQIDPNIQLDALSRQLCMVMDASAFTNQVLNPAIDLGSLVIADRSNFISSIAYGKADGLDLATISTMFSLVKPIPTDRLYVLQCPWEFAKNRMLKQNGGDRIGLDYFERKGPEFFETLQDVYDNLISGPPDLVSAVCQSVRLHNIKYVDATQSLPDIRDEIIEDIVKLFDKKKKQYDE